LLAVNTEYPQLFATDMAGTDGIGFIPLTIHALLTCVLLGQGVKFEVNVQTIESPFTREAFEYIGLFVPTIFPLSLHWYDGDVPPFVGVAVNVTLVPLQTGNEGFAERLRLTAVVGVTAMVIVFDIAGLFVAQLMFEVNWQLTCSPSDKTKLL
jgi:hypothetical protein